MISIKIDDILFSHAKYSTDYQNSNSIIWNRDLIIGNENVAFYTDNTLTRVNNNVKTKIAWLLESPFVSSQWHDWIKKNHNLFDLVLTNNKDLLEINDKFKFAPTGGCWIKPEDQKVYEKTKLISIIASSKNFTDGHKIRNEILKNNKGLDIYGRGHNPIDYKLDGLKNYMFSIVVENTKKDYYFTEKIIDCFRTGTIPIYWGCPSIGNYFDNRGILSFDNINEMNKIINEINPEMYNQKLNSIIENFNISKEYLIAEDYIYEKYLKGDV